MTFPPNFQMDHFAVDVTNKKLFIFENFLRILFVFSVFHDRVSQCNPAVLKLTL